MRFWKWKHHWPQPGEVCRYLVKVQMSCTLRILVLSLIVVVTGCDPGYSYSPIDENNRPVSKYSTDTSGLVVTIPGFEILVGSGNMLQWLTVRNNTETEAILVSGVLNTNGKTIPADLPGEGEEKWRMVKPGETAEIVCLFDLSANGGTADEVLARTITWDWTFRVGAETRLVKLTMRRDR